MSIRAQVAKSVAILVCLLIASIVLVPPAVDYEHSIYHATPLLVWASFTILAATGLLIIGFAAVVKQCEDWWPIGFGAVATVFSGFHILPLLRDYHLYARFSSDLLLHLGVIQNLINTGSLETYRYPASYLFSGSVSIVTRIEPESMMYIIPLWFNITFVILFGLCTWSLTRSNKMTLLTILFSFPIYFGVHRLLFMPYLIGLTILPLLLLTAHQYNRTGKIQWIAGFLTSSVALTLYHPLSMLFGLFVVTGYFVIYIREGSSDIESGIILTSVSIVLLVAWYVIGGILDAQIRTVGLRLISGSPGAAETTQQAGTGFQTWNAVILFVENFGVLVILFGLSSIVVINILWQWLRGQSTRFERLIASQFILAGVVSVAFFVVQLWGTTVARTTQYLILVSIFAIAVGAFRGTSWVSRHNQTVHRLFSTAVISSVVIIALFSGGVAYNDGMHKTDAIVSGYGWTLDEKTDQGILRVSTSRDVFAYYWYGYTGAIEMSSDRNIYGHANPPHRLGQINKSISQTLNPGEMEAYIVTHDADTTEYHSLPNWRQEKLTRYYTKQDRERVAFDPTAQGVYSNGELETWYVMNSTE